MDVRLAQALEASGGAPEAFLDALFAAQRGAIEPPHEFEAIELLLRVLAAKLGISFERLLAKNSGNRAVTVRELRSQGAFICSDNAMRAHCCEGHVAESHWQLKQIDRVRYSIGDKFLSADVLKNERKIEAGAKAGCELSYFSRREHFTAYQDGRTYVASGRVYICRQTGKSHVCTEQLCDRTVPLPGNEGLVCALTKNHYAADSVYKEPNVSRETRDGSVTVFDNGHHRSGGGGGGGGGGHHPGGSYHHHYNNNNSRGWHSVRNKQQRESCRHRKLAHLRHIECTGAAARALDGRSRMYYESVGAHVTSRLERTMREYYPDATLHPQASESAREQVRHVCRLLIEEGARVMFCTQINRIQEADAKAFSAVNAYLRESARSQKRRDPVMALCKYMSEMQPAFERFESTGFSQPQQVDKRFLSYLEDCVIIIWTMLHYMPYAKRFAGGIPLQKHIVGILFKLQSGYYITRNIAKVTSAATSPPSIGSESRKRRLDAEEARTQEQFQRVVLIPQHPSITLPQKDDLNKQTFFSSRGLSSASVLDTERLISHCFSSLTDGTRAVEEVFRFELSKYIRLCTGEEELDESDDEEQGEEEEHQEEG